MVHVVIQQKLPQHCKAIIFQLKVNLKKKESNLHLLQIPFLLWTLFKIGSHSSLILWPEVFPECKPSNTSLFLEGGPKAKP